MKAIEVILVCVWVLVAFNFLITVAVLGELRENITDMKESIEDMSLDGTDWIVTVDEDGILHLELNTTQPDGLETSQ